MAFTVEGEYKRLKKAKEEREKKSQDKHLGFECGCACGYVTRIEYQPREFDREVGTWTEEAITIYAIAGFSNQEQLVLYITENDVIRAHNRRKYKYWKEFGVLESYVR